MGSLGIRTSRPRGLAVTSAGTARRRGRHAAGTGITESVEFFVHINEDTARVRGAVRNRGCPDQGKFEGSPQPGAARIREDGADAAVLALRPGQPNYR